MKHKILPVLLITFSVSVMLYIKSEASTGSVYPTGDYGSMQTNLDGKGGWEGFSINGRYVFMSSDNSNVGIYDDISNRWRQYWDADDYELRHQNNELIMWADENAHTYLYHNNTWKIRTESDGVRVNNKLRVDTICNQSNGSCVSVNSLSAGALSSVRYNPGQISSRTINTTLNHPDSRYVTFYAATQDTANYLCRTKQNKPFGYWRSVAEPSNGGWAPYWNLSITAYDPTVVGSRKILCTHGSNCYSGRYQYGTVLDCWDSPVFPRPTTIPTLG